MPDIEIEPASCQLFVPEGLVVPSPEGLTTNDIKYCVFQFQVIFDGAVIAKVIADAVPEAETLPVPDQPVQTY